MSSAGTMGPACVMTRSAALNLRGRRVPGRAHANRRQRRPGRACMKGFSMNLLLITARCGRAAGLPVPHPRRPCRAPARACGHGELRQPWGADVLRDLGLRDLGSAGGHAARWPETLPEVALHADFSAVLASIAVVVAVPYVIAAVSSLKSGYEMPDPRFSLTGGDRLGPA